MENKLADPSVDTNVLIRLLTGDDLKKQKASTQLFERVEQGDLTLSAPDTVIADAVYVLSSPRLYSIPRTTIRDLLMTLLRLTNFKVDNKNALMGALDLYASSTIDFGDALLAVVTLQSQSKTLYSYDHDFDNLTGIIRKEP